MNAGRSTHAKGSFKSTYSQTRVSWSRVREYLFVKFFKKCGISNALYGSEDNLIHEEDNDDDKEEEEEEEEEAEGRIRRIRRRRRKFK